MIGTMNHSLCNRAMQAPRIPILGVEGVRSIGAPGQGGRAGSGCHPQPNPSPPLNSQGAQSVWCGTCFLGIGLCVYTQNARKAQGNSEQIHILTRLEPAPHPTSHPPPSQPRNPRYHS